MAGEYVMNAETITVRSSTEGFEVDRHFPDGAVAETLSFSDLELVVLPGPEVDSTRRPAQRLLQPGEKIRVHSDGTGFIGHLVPRGEERAVASLRLPEPAIVFSRS
jgi:hypothetical protein